MANYTAAQARELLKNSISMWWLRPENGLAVAGYCYNGMDINTEKGQRSADYACGDGVNTFFKCGGRFSRSFDIFGTAIAPADQKRVISERIDVFDYFDKSYAPDIAERPTTRFTYGTDHKGNLLKKAETLDFYDQLIEADLEKDCPEIADGSLDLIYCNSIYWVPNPEIAFKQMIRKLKPGGRAVFDVMTAHRKRLQFAHAYPAAPKEWQDLLNRGREQNNPGLRSESQWDDIFSGSGTYKITDKRSIFHPAVARFWNFGVRPLAPVLNRMANMLTPEDRLSIKQEWVEVWTDLLLPLLREPDEILHEPQLRVRLQYEVRL
jgi:SAM-dependent methyltransferase